MSSASATSTPAVSASHPPGPSDTPALDDLFAPLDRASFLADHYEQAPIRLAGAAVRGRSVLTEARMKEAILSENPRRGRLILFGDTTFDQPLSANAPLRLEKYLERGYPVIWNGARGLSDTIDSLCVELAQAFGAYVWPNVYWTGAAGAPFDMHFDAHEVFIVQCAGVKDWRISTLRVDRPLEIEATEAVNRAAQEASRESARQRIALSFRAEPGDVIYIPRGQFHGATTPAGRSLHVTFGMRPVSGFDVLMRLAQMALEEPVVRSYMPAHGDHDPAGRHYVGAIQRLGAELRHLTTDALIEQALGAARADAVERSRG